MIRSLKEKWHRTYYILTTYQRHKLPLGSRILVACLRPLVLAIKKCRYDRCLEQAAALSFVAVLSAIPVGFLFIFFLHAFGLQEYWDQFRKMILENSVGTAEKSLRTFLGELEQNPLSTRSGTPLFFLAVGALLVSALWLFEASEKALNRIWGVMRKRPYVQRFMVFWALVTASPFLLAFSVFIKGQVEKSPYIAELVNTNVLLAAFYSLLVPVIVASLAFSVVYLLLPATRVKLIPALVGGLLAGFLWELAMMWLSYTIPNAITFNIYGSLGAIACVLIWFYVSCTVLLFGAQLSCVVQHPKETVSLLQSQREKQALAPGFLALAVAIELTKASQHRKAPPSLEEFSEKWAIPKEEIAEEISQFTPDFFHLSADDPTCYYLSRDSDHVYASDFLAASNKTICGPYQNIGGKAFQEFYAWFRTATQEALGGLTVRDIVHSNFFVRGDKPA